MQILEDYLGAFLRGNELVFKPLPSMASTEILVEYCRNHSQDRIELTQIREILQRVPFSLSERVGVLREEEP